MENGKNHPLLKKGDTQDMTNYRPISNLCSISKLFERIILNRINSYDPLVGSHQHGFRPNHGTSSAVVDLQRIIAGKLDQRNECVVYSVDLSAAFDMLRRKTLMDSLKGCYKDGILHVINDFLGNRKCKVEIDGTTSEPFDVELGCVQGSVLGPKLFNLYTRKIPDKLTANADMVTYADDSYVVISCEDGQELETETSQCLEQHCEYLRQLGMVVNRSKTEAILLSRRNPRSMTLNCGNEKIETMSAIKVLGITMDNKLTWSDHISKTLNKMNQLNGALRFLRRRLNERQFTNVLTSQYYGMCYYGCQAWLGRHTRHMDLKKLNSMHYRLLQIIKRDWKQKIKREDLDKIGRARPTTWAKYATASFTVKILRDTLPRRLHDHLRGTLYYERRQDGVLKFYDNSKSKVGAQAIGNRLGYIFSEIKTPIRLNESDDQLRLTLKKV